MCSKVGGLGCGGCGIRARVLLKLVSAAFAVAFVEVTRTATRDIVLLLLNEGKTVILSYRHTLSYCHRLIR